MIKIHVVATVFPSDQGIVHHHTTIAFNHVFEHVVDGRLGDDAVTWFGVHLQRKSKTTDDTRHEGNPVFFDVPVVERLLPVDDGREIVVINAGVAQYGVLESLTQGIEDERRCGKIHISDPEGDEVSATIECLQSSNL